MITCNLGWKGFILSYDTRVHAPSLWEIRAGTQEANLEAWSESEIVDKLCLVAFFLWLVQPVFKYTPNHLSRGHTAASRLYPPTGKLMKAFSQLSFLIPDISSLFQDDKNNQEKSTTSLKIVNPQP